MISPTALEAYLEGVRRSGPCPDCPADIGLTRLAPGVWRIDIQHEDTCPAYRAMRLSGRAS